MAPRFFFLFSNKFTIKADIGQEKRFQSENFEVQFCTWYFCRWPGLPGLRGKPPQAKFFRGTIFLNQSGIISNRNMPPSFCIKNPKENIFFYFFRQNLPPSFCTKNPKKIFSFSFLSKICLQRFFFLLLFFLTQYSLYSFEYWQPIFSVQYWWLTFSPSADNLYFPPSTDSSYFYPSTTYIFHSADTLYIFSQYWYLIFLHSADSSVSQCPLSIDCLYFPPTFKRK